MFNITQIYILIAILALLAIFILLFFVKKNKEYGKLSLLASLSFAFVIAGIVFILPKNNLSLKKLKALSSSSMASASLLLNF